MILGAILSLLLQASQPSAITPILLNELDTLLQQEHNILLVDLLPEEAYLEGHIPGALSLPWPVWPQFLEKGGFLDALPPDQPIVLYCGSQTCSVAHRAALLLKKRGWTRIFEFTPGRQGWVDQERLLKTGARCHHCGHPTDSPLCCHFAPPHRNHARIPVHAPQANKPFHSPSQ